MSPHQDEHLEFDHLREELHQLERRVEALEQHAEHQPLPQGDVPAFAGPDLALSNVPNAIPVVGRAVLGLAGAYLLRAVAESGTVPGLLVVGCALLYCATWLIFSRRAREQDAFAGTTYGITAALILTPLLWEATVRFHILSSSATACILIAFVVLSFSLSWSRLSGAAVMVTTLAALTTALVLMVQTGELVPFAAALLVIAGLMEATAHTGHDRKMRIPAALAADFSIWLILNMMTQSGGVPEHYKPVSLVTSLTLVAFLFAIYSASIIRQTVVLQRAITGFEIVQAVVAFALSGGGALQLTQGRAAVGVGVLCAIACAGSYAAAFMRFRDSFPRNHHVFASWGAALGLLASFLIVPRFQLLLILSAAAILTILAETRVSGRTLSIHGGLYLIAAGLTAGIPSQVLKAFTDTQLEPASSALWIIAITAVCCYALSYYARSRVKVGVESVIAALFSAISIGALIILMVVPSWGGDPTPSVLATARTLVICALALGFGFTGSRMGHRDLVWISYFVMALGTVKLVLEDFRQSHPAALAFSLVCYGALLILVPKLSAKSSIS